MAATIGNFAVSGASFYITGEDGYTYRYDGTTEGAVITAAIPGSIWVDHTNNKFYYIDANKYKRSIPLKSLGTKAGAILGSVWISSKYWNWIGANNTAYQGHSDYGDSGYSDGGYSNYSDYVPSHNDYSNYNDHGDNPPNSTFNNHLDSGSITPGYSDSGYYDSGYSDHGDHGDTPVRV